jgi:hypothetical protein
MTATTPNLDEDEYEALPLQFGSATIWHATRAIQLKHRYRQMKSLENPFRQVLLLPPGVVGRSQRDQYVVRPEQSDRIAKGAQGRFVADLTRERCPGVEGLDVRENRMQSFVGLEPRAVRVRRQPLKAGSENRRYDEHVSRRVEQRANEPRQVIGAPGRRARGG